MANDPFEITYAAHTGTCTFLLDADGICRRIVMLPAAGKRRESSKTAAQCVGAQYVASLDSGAVGGLVEMPRVGAAMLFARVDERGRVSLVRTGILTGFESHAVPDPFAESASVQTSAPEMKMPEPADSDVTLADGDEYFDASDRTQRIQALPPMREEAATAEYETAELTLSREDQPPPPASLFAAKKGSATLRNPHLDTTFDDESEYTSPPSRVPVRGIRRQRSTIRAVQAAAVSLAPIDPHETPRAGVQPAASDVQISSRRRGG